MATLSDYREAIASIESQGSGGYSALGPTQGSGDRAYGRYQIMGSNIGPWTEQALGYRMSPSEFLANQRAQDAVFDHVFGGYVARYGPDGAAQAWFAGPGSVGASGAENRRDSLGTSVRNYVDRFKAALGQARENVSEGVTERLQGGTPVLSAIRDRLRAKGRQTPYLDAMIANRELRRDQPMPFFDWAADQRRNAGLETPIMDIVQSGRPQQGTPIPEAFNQPGVPFPRPPMPSALDQVTPFNPTRQMPAPFNPAAPVSPQTYPSPSYVPPSSMPPAPTISGPSNPVSGAPFTQIRNVRDLGGALNSPAFIRSALPYIP